MVVHACNCSYVGGINRNPAPSKIVTLSEKELKIFKKVVVRNWCMAQVVEWLPSKHESLRSNPI
jgi:hypothetical protein